MGNKKKGGGEKGLGAAVVTGGLLEEEKRRASAKTRACCITFRSSKRGEGEKKSGKKRGAPLAPPARHPLRKKRGRLLSA